jgi:hypothetical protein
MKKHFSIYCLLALTTLMGLSACSETDETIPKGMGQVEVRLTSPYKKVTRADDDWLNPISDKEMIKEYWVVFVNSSNKVEEIIHENLSLAQEEHTFRFMIVPGSYTVYGFANLPPATTFESLGITKGSIMPDLTTKKLATTNGWTGYIPMTSHTGGQAITVVEAENQSFEVELIRTMAKLELTFINNSQQQMDILGYEIYPLTKTNVSLLELDNPENIVSDDTVSHKVQFSESDKLVLPAKTEGADPTSKTTYVYVNETNLSATATHNQYSIRIKARRHRDVSSGVDDYRYGFTVNSETSGTSWPSGTTNGFDYIRRNDWIKLPIMFTDWTFRIEALPFPPIAGFQARVLSADALSITFNSGGYIFLRPMFRNNADPEGVWRGFDDSDVTFVLPGEPYNVNGETASPLTVTKTQPYAWTTPATGVAESIDYNSVTETGTKTGIVMTGNLDIFEQRFVQLESGDIVGKLINDDTKKGLVTVTIKLKLEGFSYQFNYNILKQ